MDRSFGLNIKKCIDMSSEPKFVEYMFDMYSEHQANNYSSIWGKSLYRVAFNPLDDTGMKVYHMNVSRCSVIGKYPLVRSIL